MVRGWLAKGAFSPSLASPTACWRCIPIRVSAFATPPGRAPALQGEQVAQLLAGTLARRAAHQTAREPAPHRPGTRGAHPRPLYLPLPAPGSAGPLAGLKRYEDALDALVCAWVATLYLDGKGMAYNGADPTAAIWVPGGRGR